MMKRRNPVVLCVTLLLSGCGGSKNPVAPPLPQPAQIAGNWSGTLESSNYVPLAVFVTLNQTATAISGTWAASTGTTGLAGNLTGTVDPTSFTGSMTLSVNQSPGCAASVSGGAATGSVTLTWTSAGFTGNCGLAGGNPTSPRLVLQRR